MGRLSRSLLLILTVLLVTGFAGISHGKGLYLKDEIVVKFKSGVTADVIRGINRVHGVSIVSVSRKGIFSRLKVPAGTSVEELVAEYSRNPDVEYAEPNYLAHTYFTPDDPLYPVQWHLYNPEYGGINMEAAWEIQTGDPAVIVAVIDTGVAYEDYVSTSGRSVTYEQAPDLSGTNFVAGYDFVNSDTHPNDDEGHGTHVTGTIAQSTNNSLGTAGVAFNTSIMPIKVLDSNGSGSYTDIADGIYFAADNGADVISMSLGGSSASITLEDALAYAYNKGVTIVAAAGNDGTSTIGYPAAYDAYVIAVGATRYDETLAYYSNFGASLDIVAPGGDTNVDQNGDGYVDGVLQQTFDSSPTDWGYFFYMGTSMATPHVSGVAALVIANGVTGPDNVREVLQITARDLGAAGWDSTYGWGIVDAYAALTYSTTPGNNPPVADAGGPYTAAVNVVVTFYGSSSYDPDGDSITYQWNFGDGSTGTGVAPTHIYTSAGIYTVSLLVNDGTLDSDLSLSTATITSDVNNPPVADAGPDQTALVNEVVTFDGSGSYDIDDGIAAYEWNFGDGLTGNGEITAHAYASAGVYTVALTVTDNSGETASDTAIVTVTEQPALVMYVASIDMAIRSFGRNAIGQATVTIVDAGGSAVAGAAVSGSWSNATMDSDTGITDASGKIFFESDRVRKVASGTTFTFTVTNVTLSGWSYDSGANAETSDSIAVP